MLGVSYDHNTWINNNVLCDIIIHIAKKVRYLHMHYTANPPQQFLVSSLSDLHAQQTNGGK